MDSGADAHKCKVCGQEVGFSFLSVNPVVPSAKCYFTSVDCQTVCLNLLALFVGEIKVFP